MAHGSWRNNHPRPLFDQTAYNSTLPNGVAMGCEVGLAGMKLSGILEWLEGIAPLRYAEAWDNVGLLVGDRQQTVSRGMLCIDYTDAVADEAKDAGCDFVIAYHPPIFKAMKRLVAPCKIHDAIRRGVAIYSPHTALDVAEGGTNDVLADAIGLVDRQPLKLSDPKVTVAKLVTFVPKDQVETVANALFQAGAGKIGNYSSCSFRTEGEGTFFGEKGSNPQAGKAGQLERTSEIKIETVVPLDRLSTVIAALRAVHPYEEPAFDIVQLMAPPVARGMGRIGRFDSPIMRDVLFNRIKQALQIDHLLIAGATTGIAHTAAVCAGSCGDLLDEAIRQKADVYLTGEMRHHDALKAAAAGMTVICTLHSHSERITLRHLRDRLAEEFAPVHWQLAATDRDPFAIR